MHRQLILTAASHQTTLHAKVANRRKDSLHQFSTRLVRGYDTVFVGNVSASNLVKTPKAKSVLDAGWSAFRTMLRYKCAFAGATFAEVNEAFSTQTCSACNSRSGPKGIAGLGIREWTCGECGAVHDRNVNAAKNILAAGRRRLAEGIPALLEGAGGRQLISKPVAADHVLSAKRLIPKIMQDLLLGLPGTTSGIRRMDFESSSYLASESGKG